MSIDVNKLAEAVMKELETYDARATVAAKQAVEKVAEDCRRDIMASAPQESGKYAKSWKKKLAYSSANEIRYTIYSTKYQLTHLLEYGHEKWLWGEYTGGRVSGKPHIRPAEARAEESLIKELKKSL